MEGIIVAIYAFVSNSWNTMFFIYAVLILATLVGSNGIDKGRGVKVVLVCVYATLAVLVVIILAIAPDMEDVYSGTIAKLQTFIWYAAVAIFVAFLDWLRRVCPRRISAKN